MTTSPFVASHHPTTGGYQPHDTSIPARRPGRAFVPAPVLSGVVRAPEPDEDQLKVADAVLQQLRTVNQNGLRTSA